jgi:hypothetical protein
MSVKPISPQKAQEAKAFSIPEYVIAAVNELLVKKVHPTANVQHVVLKQDTVVEAIIAKAAEGGLDVTAQYLFDEHYLDFEALFSSAGWRVVYDKPGYNESYEAFWKFDSK